MGFTKMTMSIEEIMTLLPHRYPFLLIDRVLELNHNTDSKSRLGQNCIAIKNVTMNEPFFQGHFPHRPIMPGVLIIEAAAQASAVACYKPDYPRLDVSIGSIKETRFHRPVIPGDTLTFYSEVIKDRGKMLLLRSKVMVGDAKVTETEILAHVIPHNVK